MNPIISPMHRSRARRLALQALYQWSFSQNSLQDIEWQFYEFNNMAKVDKAYFHEMIHEVPAHLDELDIHIKSHISRPFNDVHLIELFILRMAIYEFLFRRDVPYKVVINEALELAKNYGATEGYKFINSVLDKIAQEIRSG